MIPSDSRYAIGADIGGSHICSAVVDLTAMEICGEPLICKVDASAGACEILASWADNIRRTAASFPSRDSWNVGFAFPGPFDYRQGISLIRGVHKFKNIYGLNVSASLYPLLRGSGVREFRYVNDAGAFALGESIGGAANGAKRVVVLTLGTGVGSGFIAGRRLVESGDEVPANGWVYHLPFENGIVDEAFSTRWVCRRYKELTGIDVGGAREVAALYGEQPAARQLFEEYGERLARFAGPVLERFGADVLVLGGNISKAYPLFGPAMEHRLAKDRCKTRISVSTLLERAALIGGASLFL